MKYATFEQEDSAESFKQSLDKQIYRSYIVKYRGDLYEVRYWVY